MMEWRETRRDGDGGFGRPHHWPFGSRTTEELIAYGTTGAKPTLKITER